MSDLDVLIRWGRGVTVTVEDLLREAQELSREEQMRLLDELTRLLEHQERKTSSITALRGLGRHIWEGVDAQEYVHQERDSWGG